MYYIYIYIYIFIYGEDRNETTALNKEMNWSTCTKLALRAS